MEISAKIIVKELTKSILGSTSLKVCTNEKSENYHKRVSSTLIRDFLANERNISPSEKICNVIRDLFDYELFPHNYNKDGKHSASPEEMAERIRRYIVGLLSCDLTETILNDSIDIAKASELIDDLLNEIEGKNEITIEEMAHRMKMHYSKVSSFVSFDNLKDYQKKFKEYYYEIWNNINNSIQEIKQWSIDDDQSIQMMAQERANLAFNIIKTIYELIIRLINAESFEDLPTNVREKFIELTPPRTSLFFGYNHNNISSLIEVLSPGFKRKDAKKYIDFVLEVFKNKDGDNLSKESQKLLESTRDREKYTIFDKSQYDKYIWKIRFSMGISALYNTKQLDIRFLTYYLKEYIINSQRQPHRYEMGIQMIQDIYVSLNEEIKKYYKPVASSVIEELNAVILDEHFKYPLSKDFETQIKQYEPNELLIGFGGGLIWFEELICNIINILKIMQKTEEGIESGRLFY